MAKSLPHGLLMSDSWSRTHDWLRPCSNSGFSLSNFHIPVNLSFRCLRTTNRKNFSSVQRFKSFCHRRKSPLTQKCPIEFVPSAWKSLKNRLRGIFQCMNRRAHNKFSKGGVTAQARKNNLDAETEHFSLRGKLQFKEIISLYVIINLPWYGSVCFRSYFLVQR